MQPPHDRGESLIEEYLKIVEARLNALPLARRDEELMEIRQHLAALAAGHRAQGMGEREAAEAAVRQFGQAERIGGDLRKAWDKREHKIPLWNLAVLFMCLFFGFFTSITGPGDFPHRLAPRITISAVLTCVAVSIIYFTRQDRVKQ